MFVFAFGCKSEEAAAKSAEEGYEVVEEEWDVGVKGVLAFAAAGVTAEDGGESEGDGEKKRKRASAAASLEAGRPDTY